MWLLADMGEAMGCSTNTFDTNWFIKGKVQQKIKIQKNSKRGGGHPKVYILKKCVHSEKTLQNGFI